jgi:hypothetical protein
MVADSSIRLMRSVKIFIAVDTLMAPFFQNFAPSGQRIGSRVAETQIRWANP